MVNIQNLQKRITRVLQVTSIGWGSLGFYRGIQDYDYEHQNDLEIYNRKMHEYNESLKKYKTRNPYYSEPTLPEKPHKYYLTTLSKGLAGTCFYLNPIFLLFYVSKELYRLEAYLRNIDDVKNKTYYKKL
jgi:hypothetical protein